MTSYGAALIDFLEGDHDAHFILRRDDGFVTTVPARIFFSSEFSSLEEQALSSCHGRVLDVGAGAGKHSLSLQARGLEVHSLDNLPEVIRVLKRRGVLKPILGDIMTFKGEAYDTLLFLMNGIGMVGTLSQLDDFLVHALSLVRQGGCILCDSIDVSVTTNPVHVHYRERNTREGRFPGQQYYTALRLNQEDPPFPWLHLDFLTLSARAKGKGWKADLIGGEPDGHYLARLTKVSTPTNGEDHGNG